MRLPFGLFDVVRNACRRGVCSPGVAEGGGALIVRPPLSAKG